MSVTFGIFAHEHVVVGYQSYISRSNVPIGDAIMMMGVASYGPIGIAETPIRHDSTWKTFVCRVQNSYKHSDIYANSANYAINSLSV